MSQSIKLNDNNFVDAEGVYVHQLGVTLDFAVSPQEKALGGQGDYVDFTLHFNGTYFFSNTDWSSQTVWVASRTNYGTIVSVLVNGAATQNSYVTASVPANGYVRFTLNVAASTTINMTLPT